MTRLILKNILWPIFRLEGHKERVDSVSWNPNGTRLASGSFDNTIMIWDAKSGEKIHTLEGHKGSVNSISWNPDGSRLASCSDDKTIMIWDAKSGEMIHTLEGHKGSVNSFPEHL